MSKLTAALVVGATALLCTTALTAPEAAARGRHAVGQIHTQRGTATAERTTSRMRGERFRSTTITGPGGRSTTATDTRTVDRAAGTATHDRDRTFADGTTRSVDASAERTGDGTYAATRTVTGRNGETRTQTGDFARTATADGHSVSGTIETQNHGEVDYQRDVSHADGTRTVNASSTFQDGTSRSRTSSTSRDAASGAVTSTTSLTNRQGGVTSSTSVRTPTDAGATTTRNTTFPDGSTREVDRTRTDTGPGSATIDRRVTGRNGETRTQTGTVVVTRDH